MAVVQERGVVDQMKVDLDRNIENVVTVGNASAAPPSRLGVQVSFLEVSFTLTCHSLLGFGLWPVTDRPSEEARQSFLQDRQPSGRQSFNLGHAVRAPMCYDWAGLDFFPRVLCRAFLQLRGFPIGSDSPRTNPGRSDLALHSVAALS